MVVSGVAQAGEHSGGSLPPGTLQQHRTGDPNPRCLKPLERLSLKVLVTTGLFSAWCCAWHLVLLINTDQESRGRSSTCFQLPGC
jgi:hypothetical protein